MRRPSVNKNWMNIFVILISSYALNLILNWIFIFIGLKADSAFFSSKDAFADAFKTPMAIPVFRDLLMADARVAHWPQAFQDYFHNNPYIFPEIIKFPLPPVTMVYYVIVAIFLIFAPPMFIIITFGIIYAIMSGSIMTLLENGRRRLSEVFFGFLCLMFCFPAVYCFQRGNFQAAFVALGVIVYLSSAVYGRYRWLGLLSIIYSISVRPNLAIISIFELTQNRPIFKSILNMVLIGIGVGLISILSIIFVQKFFPQYNMEYFLNGYEIYEKYYVVGSEGLRWNSSIFGAVQSIRHLMGISPYNADFVEIITILGLLTLLGVVYVILTKKLNRSETAFVLVMFSILFTPVYATYHMLAILSIFPVLLAETKQRSFAEIFKTFWMPFVSISLLGAAVRLPGAPAWLVIFVTAAAFTPLGIKLLLDRGGDPESVNFMMLLTCLLVLCPLGGEFTNGIAIAALLASSSLVVIVSAARRKSNPTPQTAHSPVE